MSEFFAYDGRFFRFMNRLTDFIILNLLWLLFSLPVFTCGASTYALTECLLNIHLKKEGYIVRGFLKALRSQFKKTTVIWLSVLSGVVILLSAILLISKVQSPFWQLAGLVFWMMIFFAVSGTLSWSYPLIYFRNGSCADIMKETFITMFRYLPWTVMMLIGRMLFAYVITRNILLLMGWLILGMSVYQYILGYIFLHFLKGEEEEGNCE